MNAINDKQDVDLVTGLSGGDRLAFESIYRKYASDLFDYARNKISSTEDCKEIIQDVFVSLWARHESLKIDNLRAYLYGTVKYKVIHYFRHSTLKQKYAEHFILFQDVYDPFDEAERNIDPEAIHALIEKSLPALPARCQDAFRMRLVQNLSISEIASRMNITKRTVNNYLQTAMNHLRSSYRTLYIDSIPAVLFFILM